MPGADAILQQLATAANDHRPWAVGWHLVVLGVMLALAWGWRPSRRLAGALLALPAASVAAVAFGVGNPFNGTSFLALALALALGAPRLGRERVESRQGFGRIAGLASIAYAWTYPHFVDTDAALGWLLMAPVGIIPCPTLALIIGFTLLADGFGSRARTALVAAWGLFYGVFGVAVLGVRLDVALVVAALALLPHVWRPARAGGPHPARP